MDLGKVEKETGHKESEVPGLDSGWLVALLTKINNA